MTVRATRGPTFDVQRVGVIVERRESANPWADAVWAAVDVLPGEPGHEAGRVIAEGAGWQRYYAGAVDIELHHRETEAYKTALSQDAPPLFVVMRPSEAGDGALAFEPFVATFNPYEGGDYTEGGDLIVSVVPAPGVLLAWLASFVETHHVDQPFVKRKQKRKDSTATDRVSDPLTRASGTGE